MNNRNWLYNFTLGIGTGILATFISFTLVSWVLEVRYVPIPNTPGKVVCSVWRMQ